MNCPAPALVQREFHIQFAGSRKTLSRNNTVGCGGEFVSLAMALRLGGVGLAGWLGERDSGVSPGRD